ncbi:hypothetical protein SprV_0200783900 [Sparganum proliferum]
MELTPYLSESLGTAESLHDFPQSAVYRIEGFRRIQEGRVQMGPHLLALLLQLADDEDHFGGPAMTGETALAFRPETLFQMVVQTVEKDASEDLSGDVEHGDPSAGTPVGAEKRSSSFGWRTVDSLDRGEAVLPFAAVRAPLDLLGLASRPSILHPSQPLLNKSASTIEGCFVVADGEVDVGFVQSVLLGELVADDGVVVIEPVSMLVKCATEDNQGN